MIRPLLVHYAFLIAALWLAVAAACFGEELRQRAPGPYEVSASEPVVIADPQRQQDVTFRVWSPVSSESFPVVVFSHGGFCPSQNYARILGHWVSHGYIVIAPDHVDSPNQANQPTGEAMQSIVQTRVRDVSLALDALAEIRAATDMQAKPNTDRVAVAGHSFGSGVAMMKAGLVMREEDKGPWGPAHDERFIAAVFFSPPGGGDEMAPDAFDGLQGPFISTGGSKDVGRVDPGEFTPAEWRRQAFLNAPPGNKYALTLEDADHYLGGLICNPERGGEPDPDAVEIFSAVTTVFLDAHVNGNDAARSYLQEADIAAAAGSRTDFRRR